MSSIRIKEKSKMDPDATLARYWAAVAAGERDEAQEARDDLLQWLQRKGFEPDWKKSGHSRQQFFYSRPAKRHGLRAPAKKLDSFTRAYMEAALFSSNDESRDDGGDPLDGNYSIGDISAHTKARMIQDCDDFQTRYADLLSESGLGNDQAGGDFWLSRNRHGSGFFDEDVPGADALQEAAKKYGEVNLYVGDDGEIHASGGGHEANESRTVRTPGRKVRMPALDGDYCVQQLYSDGSFVGGGESEEWYDDEQEAVSKAKRIASSSSFEGDYTRVITRDGEAVWSSRDPRSKRAREVRAPSASHKRAYEFFRKQAGGRVGYSAETAHALAKAEQEAGSRGWRVQWEDDPEGWDSLGDIDPKTVNEVLAAVLYDEQGNVLGSLGSIVDPDRNYARVVEAELALEALPRETRGVVRSASRVRDYEVIDRRDRRTAGPFKHRHEADARRGPGDVVRFVPSSRAREVRTSAPGLPAMTKLGGKREVRARKQPQTGIRVWRGKGKGGQEYVAYERLSDQGRKVGHDFYTITNGQERYYSSFSTLAHGKGAVGAHPWKRSLSKGPKAKRSTKQTRKR